MPKVSETIPSELQPRVDAALAWFNASENAENEAFKVTGIVDAEDALRGSDELRLIMCGGDRCEQRSFRVAGTNNAWEVELADDVLATQGDKPQAELDPPPGVRSSWLDKALSQHAFVVLLFYRGFW
ncbi:MAG: hypothetical protein JJ934_01095 [Pseudomonadales bacterium]|nr:hypothetical protein [Pseudomonadales bacterium]MBO6594618.1 hypothetical protein [Pseudomonadales bacterium]MBO6655455.1 hypothetical protein [Pseudomonadales bacterium]MBO6821822.1 hypothetical protein [Pseudomonadales bacterium]